MPTLDFTHDPQRQSWLASANQTDCDFPVQNLPFAVFQTPGQSPRIGVGIGDQILDLHWCLELGHLAAEWQTILDQPNLNRLMATPAAGRGELRQQISRLLGNESAGIQEQLSKGLIPQQQATLLLPCKIGDYTDFYASIHHATNVGMMLRPDNPLLPNYKHIPIGYHGRSSSIVVSGTSVVRPWGQQAPESEEGLPGWNPCRMLDYELEVGCFIGPGNNLGHPLSLDEAADHLFGICLLNDWSARDVQKWEYQPLGPFLAKSFASSISAWVVTMEALAPFRCPEFPRPGGDPKPLPYLSSRRNRESGGIDLTLEVLLRTEAMAQQNIPAQLLSRGKFNQMYWTFAQMLAHHSSNGCNMQPGDLIGSGTVSNATKESRGCLLEMTWDGSIENPLPSTQRTALELPSGETRKFLQDGDEVIIRGFCENGQYRRIGIGECSGKILPAPQL
jgi:fumarylacetoacetase